MSTAALIVTHDSGKWIEQTLVSVLTQSTPVDTVLVVDDHSSDDTVDLARQVLGEQGRIVQAMSTATDTSTRIAQNFRQGLVALADVDVVVLGDHDDIWHRERVAQQVAVLASNPQVLMAAGDGRLVDGSGLPIGGTLRTAFPIPDDWAGASASDRMRMALRRSVATGGASAVRPFVLAQHMIPAGWLHDRWWSLLATAMEAMLIDDRCVIDYRVSNEQQVGLSRGLQDRSSAGRIGAVVQDLPRTLARLNDVRQLRSVATSRTRPELGGLRLLRNFA